MKGKWKEHIGTIVVILLLIAVAAGAVPATRRAAEIRELRDREAVEQILLGDRYSRDKFHLSSLFEDRGNDRTWAALRKLQSARFQYERGELEKAVTDLDQIDPDCITETNREAFIAFRDRVKGELEEIIRTKEEGLRMLDDPNSPPPETPFVGMPETRIGDSALGRPSSYIGHNKGSWHGFYTTANLYYFFRDGEPGRIFIARCMGGEVTEVFDYRDDPWVIADDPARPGRKASPQQAPSSGSKSGSKSGGKKYDTPDTSGFADAEDFYEFYRDDFYDLEDAEDYYYANGGE